MILDIMRDPMRRLAFLCVLAVAAGAAAGCDGAASGSQPEAQVRVVATTTQVADLARTVAGKQADVRALLTAGADPHGFEPRPSDLDALADADLIVRSGGEVDAWLVEAIEAAGADAPVVDLLGEVRRLGDDPHWWQDPRNAELAVAAIAKALEAADPTRAERYAAAAADSRRALRAADRRVDRCLATIPAARRKLVTSHDSLAYFARRFGLKVVGAVIPSNSSHGQASAGDVAALVTTIRREGVPAVFAEHALPAKVEQAIAREAGAREGGALYTDALGPAGSGADTYLGALAANARAIHAGLASSGARACEL